MISEHWVLKPGSIHSVCWATRSGTFVAMFIDSELGYALRSVLFKVGKYALVGQIELTRMLPIMV
jgi:hypothetical protein